MHALAKTPQGNDNARKREQAVGGNGETQCSGGKEPLWSWRGRKAPRSVPVLIISIMELEPFQISGNFKIVENAHQEGQEHQIDTVGWQRMYVHIARSVLSRCPAHAFRR